MAFRSNREIEGTSVGSRLQLTAPVRVLKGEFASGSVLRVIGEPDSRGEFECVDEESGEHVRLHSSLSSYKKYNPGSDDLLHGAKP